jgi:hypothetical protein
MAKDITTAILYNMAKDITTAEQRTEQRIENKPIHL